MDKLNNSPSTNLSDVEKVKLNIKLDGVSLDRVSSKKKKCLVLSLMKTYHGNIILMQFQNYISRNMGMLTKLKHFVPENM